MPYEQRFRLSDSDLGPVYLGLSIRALIFLVVCYFPMPYGVGAPISPFHHNGLDLHLYEQVIDLFGGSNLALQRFTDTYLTVFSGGVPGTRYAGPTLPFLIWVTNYEPGNTLLLATIIFLLECFTYCVWQQHITSKVRSPLAYTFALLPQPIWFGLIVSSDILFYCFSTLVIHNHLRGKPARSGFSLVFLLLAIFSRPVGLGLPLYLFGYSLFQFIAKRNSKDIVDMLFFALVFIFATVYYSPYFLTEQENLARFSPITQFMQDYQMVQLNELLLGLPSFVLTVLFFFGFHPSETELAVAFLIRLFAGVCFFVGYIALIFSKSFLKYYVLIMTLPIVIFFYPAWRYLLPVIPIIFLWFLMFLETRSTRTLDLK